MVGSKRAKEAVSARTEGARRASGVGADGAAVGAGALAPWQRWSVSRGEDHARERYTHRHDSNDFRGHAFSFVEVQVYRVPHDPRLKAVR